MLKKRFKCPMITMACQTEIVITVFAALVGNRTVLLSRTRATIYFEVRHFSTGPFLKLEKNKTTAVNGKQNRNKKYTLQNNNKQNTKINKHTNKNNKTKYEKKQLKK